jgi:hypothetical protein
MKEHITDHDLLIRLDEKFENFHKQYILDMQRLTGSLEKEIQDHSLKLKAHEARLDAIDELIVITRTSANIYRIVGGFIGGLIVFLLTQLPTILRNWNLIK